MSNSNFMDPHSPRFNLPKFVHTSLPTTKVAGKAIYRSSTPLHWKAWNPSGIDITYSMPYTTLQSPAVLTGEVDIRAHTDLMTSEFSFIKTPHGSSLCVYWTCRLNMRAPFIERSVSIMEL